MSARWQLAMVAALWFAALAVGLGCVYTRHQARVLFVELQQLAATRDALDIEWGRLRIEQSALATHGRIDQIARARLNMIEPDPERVPLVRP